VLLPGEDQVLAHRELRKHLQQLESTADAEAVEVARPLAGERAPVDAHFAGRGRQLSEDAVEERRLA
jgi:hypothetical protein